MTAQILGSVLALLLVFGVWAEHGRRKWKARAFDAQATLNEAWEEFDARHAVVARAIRRATGVSASRYAHPEHAAEIIDRLLEEAGTQL